MHVSETQKGAIAENLIANWLMTKSGGRLSPYKPVADDGGIDLLAYDRQTRRTLLLQVKCRTRTDAMTSGKNRAIFRVRMATFETHGDFHIVGVLLSPDLHSPEAFWLVPSAYVQTNSGTGKKGGIPRELVIECNPSPDSKDKWSSFRTHDPADFVRTVLEAL